jgi:mannose-6-phosphate isomerase-like protein (cupin superfamily)
MSSTVKPGKKFSLRQEGPFLLKEVFNQGESNLEYLSLSHVEMSRGRSPCLAFPEEETLLFLLEGKAVAQVENQQYSMEKYDVLYIPVGSPFRIQTEGPLSAYAYRALGTEKFPVHYASWQKISGDPRRIRKLHRKNVYLMFDVTEPANKLVAGYTFYEPYTRAWPPHNHTDQEEVYSFIEGKGAMSVYPDDEHQTFVTSVDTGDSITIPFLNYHPVFSQEDPLTFIWCIAGARYWVGDKNQDFMTGKVSKLTT